MSEGRADEYRSPTAEVRAIRDIAGRRPRTVRAAQREAAGGMPGGNTGGSADGAGFLLNVSLLNVGKMRPGA